MASKSFSKAVSGWAVRSIEEVERIRKSVIIELFSSVIMDTPVGNPDNWNMTEAQRDAARASGYVGGSLRGNWIISSGAPNTGTVEVVDPSGAKTVQNVQQFASTLTPTQSSVFLSNNLPYAYRVEFDGWSHTQAPEGMVRKNFIRVSQNLKANGRL